MALRRRILFMEIRCHPVQLFGASEAGIFRLMANPLELRCFSQKNIAENYFVVVMSDGVGRMVTEVD